MQTSTDHLQTETIEQLQLLGYKDGDTVYFRVIPNKMPDIPSDKTPRNLSANFPDIPSELASLNGKDFNIYVVVNGGGDKDADVTEGKAVFYEHDDLPKEDQLYLWQSLGLPEPTFQVYTDIPTMSFDR
jgi:hypothetical protein